MNAWQKPASNILLHSYDRPRCSRALGIPYAPQPPASAKGYNNGPFPTLFRIEPFCRPEFPIL